MTTKHTREQWEYGKKQFNADTGVHYYDITTNVEGVEIYLAEVFDEANARQMVASPDLLAALQTIASGEHGPDCEGEGGYIPPFYLDTAACDCFQNIARAAIAKAKGETP